MYYTHRNRSACSSHTHRRLCCNSAPSCLVFLDGDVVPFPANTHTHTHTIPADKTHSVLCFIRRLGQKGQNLTSEAVSGISKRFCSWMGGKQDAHCTNGSDIICLYVCL